MNILKKTIKSYESGGFVQKNRDLHYKECY